MKKRLRPTKRKRATARVRKASHRRTTRPRRTQPSAALRWNPEPEDVQRSVVQLVLSLVELIRKLMERQAIRRLEEKTLTPQEIENVGIALMKLERTVYQIARQFKLDPKDLNLDLGPIGKLH